MTATIPAPRNLANAAAERPTGPEPWTTTMSPMAKPLRSTVAKPVNRPQPPPITTSALSPSGSLITRTPGFM
jgi:hypothetical protein